MLKVRSKNREEPQPTPEGFVPVSKEFDEDDSLPFNNKIIGTRKLLRRKLRFRR